jgi:hypothetical protein
MSSVTAFGLFVPKVCYYLGLYGVLFLDYEIWNTDFDQKRRNKKLSEMGNYFFRHERFLINRELTLYDASSTVNIDKS